MPERGYRRGTVKGAASRQVKSINVCDRNYDGEHNFEVLNVTAHGGYVMGTIAVVPKFVAFCRRCAQTQPIKG